MRELPSGRAPFLGKAELLFLLKFSLIFFALFYLLLTADVSPLVSFVASAEFFLLDSAGVGAVLDGKNIYLASAAVKFVPECSGLVMAILLAALLWSTKIQEGKRVKYMLVFTPLLFVFNLLRLFVTLLALAFAPALFDAVHVLLWFVDSAVVLLIWMRAQGISVKQVAGLLRGG